MHEFDEFYRQYPRKVARKDAQKAWARLSEDERGAALEALPRHCKFWALRGEKQFVPYPASWLNGARWEDEIDVAEVAPQKATAWWQTESGTLDMAKQLGTNARPGEDFAQLRERLKGMLSQGLRRVA